jgi:hypothetical protein
VALSFTGYPAPMRSRLYGEALVHGGASSGTLGPPFPLDPQSEERRAKETTCS